MICPRCQLPWAVLPIQISAGYTLSIGVTSSMYLRVIDIRRGGRKGPNSMGKISTFGFPRLRSGLASFRRPVIRHIAMQAGPSEVKSFLLQRTSTCLGLRRFDGVAAWGTQQELETFSQERTLWSLVAFFFPA